MGGLIDHLLVMTEKAETGYYQLACLVRYDDECREIASGKGLRLFGGVKPSTVLKFLCYDSTNSARRQHGSQATHSGQRKRQEPKGFCFKFNGSGCNTSSCQLKHTMFCGDSSHGSQACKKGKRSSTFKN